MTPPSGAPALGRWIATVLRGGTLVSVAVVTVGYVVATVTGEDADGGERLSEAIASGSGHALIAIGILALSLVPAVMLSVAAGAFAKVRETRMLVTALGVIGLLLASVLGSALVGGGGI